ncbi:16S rRNA (cytidine(1402)-2'-O)-methyltransferase [Paenibacillus sp. GCM10023248]|uniref:16S rRNA (cytidine(1402)-2'-O)-methyltransferase n=1 Tax=Bacillales TaxID=1385 RepID=UPI002378CFA5|nr:MULTISPECIES: 16S rRNA (cytidine(1402)-2'-O)-methyltransferase [Bacillales]MDD9272018.1 16S rRNA (cytidine(1402)-2'-O)-methyltransferase [Paenibacillus sp. MAHUQ-63]MDR6885127.1 16S rRNA (cytidine1402-2'-O)-methyltransferase [Bacillus sp. 3255]
MSLHVQKSYREDGSAAGTLYLVATPIGNLEDMTFRAIRILKEVNLIAAEDTRQTRKLLTHFEVATRLVSYHEHNKQASGPELVRLLLEGQSIALVSDAGLPAISDPGYDLVRMAIEQGAPVVPVPGANAALSALIASGLPTERFTFVGFLPREKKEQTKVLEGLQHAQETLLFYESPHRVDKTLARMAEVWGPERRVCMARELTKRYEEFVRGTIAECLAFLEQNPPQGEYCLIAEGASAEAAKEAADGWWEAKTLAEHVEHYEAQGSDRKEAMKQVASDRGLSKRDVYNALLDR